LALVAPVEEQNPVIVISHYRIGKVCFLDNFVVGVADIDGGENITLLLLERADTVVGDIPHLRTGHYTTGMNRPLSRDNTLHPQVGIGVPTHKPPTGRLPNKYAPEHFQHD